MPKRIVLFSSPLINKSKNYMVLSSFHEIYVIVIVCFFEKGNTEKKSLVIFIKISSKNVALEQCQRYSYIGRY